MAACMHFLVAAQSLDFVKHKCFVCGIVACVGMIIFQAGHCKMFGTISDS